MGPGLTCPVTWSFVKENPDLLKKIVGRNILGLRSNITIPDRFCGYFRSAYKFNLLTGYYSMPMSLTVWLLSLWRKERKSVFTILPQSFKQSLKNLPESWIPVPVEEEIYEYNEETSLYDYVDEEMTDLRFYDDLMDY